MHSPLSASSSRRCTSARVWNVKGRTLSFKLSRRPVSPTPLSSATTLFVLFVSYSISLSPSLFRCPLPSPSGGSPAAGCRCAGPLNQWKMSAVACRDFDEPHCTSAYHSSPFGFPQQKPCTNTLHTRATDAARPSICLVEGRGAARVNTPPLWGCVHTHIISEMARAFKIIFSYVFKKWLCLFVQK